MPGVVASFFDASVQFAANIFCQSRVCKCNRIPDIKTITNYEIALEEPVGKMFLMAETEICAILEILEVLKDAKENGQWPKNYISLKYQNFYILDYEVQSARFRIKDGIRIDIRISGTFVKIYPDGIELKKISNKKVGEIAKPLNETIYLKLKEYQKNLVAIQKILK